MSKQHRQRRIIASLNRRDDGEHEPVRVPSRAIENLLRIWIVLKERRYDLGLARKYDAMEYGE